MDRILRWCAAIVPKTFGASRIDPDTGIQSVEVVSELDWVDDEGVVNRTHPTGIAPPSRARLWEAPSATTIPDGHDEVDSPFYKGLRDVFDQDCMQPSPTASLGASGTDLWRYMAVGEGQSDGVGAEATAIRPGSTKRSGS